jgi:hypothetical protein
MNHEALLTVVDQEIESRIPTHNTRDKLFDHIQRSQIQVGDLNSSKGTLSLEKLVSQSIAFVQILTG